MVKIRKLSSKIPRKTCFNVQEPDAGPALDGHEGGAGQEAAQENQLLAPFIVPGRTSSNNICPRGFEANLFNFLQLMIGSWACDLICVFNISFGPKPP